MKVVKVILIIFAVLLIIGISGVFYLSRGLETQSKIIINSVSVESIEDGIYRGEHLAGRWSNKLEVTISGHKITKIEIIDDVLFPREDVSRELFKRVMEEKQVKVDLISGATITSKAYLKSIEKALTDRVLNTK